MYRKITRTVFAVAIAAGCLFAADTSTAEAGGYGRLGATGWVPAVYSRSVFPIKTTRSTVRRTTVNRPAIFTPRHRTVYRTRTITPNTWPGAIGAPSHRYEFFQDVNGYWK